MRLLCLVLSLIVFTVKAEDLLTAVQSDGTFDSLLQKYGLPDTTTCSLYRFSEAVEIPTNWPSSVKLGKISDLPESRDKMLQFQTELFETLVKKGNTQPEEIDWVEVPQGTPSTQLNELSVLVGGVFPIAPLNFMCTYPEELVQAAGNEKRAANNYYYMTSSGREPWGSGTNFQNMQNVFGAGGYTTVYFQSAVASNIFNFGTIYVFMDGSDANCPAMETFLRNNINVIQDWVNVGGKLFINSAQNSGSNPIPMYFGGTVAPYYLTVSASITGGQGAHPLYKNSPWAPGTSWNDNYFGHNVIRGSGLTPLITGPGGDVLAEKIWGAGRVLFGGMTTSNWHSPQPQASYLRQAIHYYMSRNLCGNGKVEPGEQCDGGAACTSCRCNSGFQQTSPPSLGCADIDECAIYGYSGKGANAASCTQGVNSRTIVCKPGYYVIGGNHEAVQITLTGSTTFEGCADINECVVYGYSGKGDYTAGCSNGINTRTITCLPGYYAVAPSTPSVTLTGNAPFTGCTNINECTVYGYSGNNANTATCEDRVNQRKITCKPGYYVIGTPNQDNIVLTGNAAFTGCTDIDECTVYGYSGKGTNAESCQNMENARKITCKAGYYVEGGVMSQTSIILPGATAFAGCKEQDTCTIYGYSGKPANTAGCVAGINTRTITCLPGFYAVSPSTPTITLTGDAVFNGCLDIDECALYGYSGNSANTLSCLNDVNNRKITCKPGYYAVAPNIDNVRLVGNAAFTGCKEINECDVYGFSGKDSSLTTGCVDKINARTITCKPGYFVIGGNHDVTNITLTGNTVFAGCSDINECVVYGESGKTANVLDCKQGAVNTRIITCMPGYYAVAPDTPTITLVGSAPFMGCTNINECEVYGFGPKDGTVQSCENGLNNRTITCVSGYYAVAPTTRMITLVGSAKFNGCKDIPECTLYGTNNRPDNVVSCQELKPNWRRITCKKGYTVADHKASDASQHPSLADAAPYVDLFQNQDFYGCVLWCGDGIVMPGEACDDGNHVSGDGCGKLCKVIEPGYFCSRKYAGGLCCAGLPDEVINNWPEGTQPASGEKYVDCYKGYWVPNSPDKSIVFNKGGPFELGDAKFCGNVIIGQEEPEADYVTSDDGVKDRLENEARVIVNGTLVVAGTLHIKDSGVLSFASAGESHFWPSCNSTLFPPTEATKVYAVRQDHNALISVHELDWSTEERNHGLNTPEKKMEVHDVCTQIGGLFYVEAERIPSGSNAFPLISTNNTNPLKPGCIHTTHKNDEIPFHHKHHLIPGMCSNIMGTRIVDNSTAVHIRLNHKDLCGGHIAGITVAVVGTAALVGGGAAVAMGGLPASGAEGDYMAL